MSCEEASELTDAFYYYARLCLGLVIPHRPRSRFMIPDRKAYGRVRNWGQKKRDGSTVTSADASRPDVLNSRELRWLSGGVDWKAKQVSI